MWQQFLLKLDTNLQFFPGATEEQLNEIEKSFNLALASDLRLLLSETNGVKKAPHNYSVVWSVERIIKERKFYSEEMTEVNSDFGDYLFFADDGIGDNFGYKIDDHQNIYIWKHEDNEFSVVSDSLQTFLRDWLSGKLVV